MLHQLVEQPLRLLQVAGVKPFGEPALDWSEQFAGLLRSSLIAPEPRHAHGCAKLPGFRLLLACNGECALEIGLRLCNTPLWCLERDFARDPIDPGLPHWDRNRTRLALGEGFPLPLFRLRGGFTVSPWRTFSDAPL